MDIPSREDLNGLMTARDGWHVSIYMPTHRAGDQIRQDPIRLKNLLRTAEEELAERGMRPAEARQLLEPARNLIDDASFWRNQSDGLALLLSARDLHTYRLPLDLDERVVVGQQFHLKPLLPVLSGDGRFYVLALSQGGIRLLEGTRYSIDPVGLEDVPTSLAEALQFDDPEKEFQFRTTTAPPHGQGGPTTSGTGGDRPAVFYGTGAATEDDKQRIFRFFQKVDAGLQTRLGEDRTPLVLAGVDYLLPLYREASSYRHIVPEGVEGSPKELSDRELHRRAWELVEPIFRQAQEDAARDFRVLAGQERATSDTRQAVAAAYYGRVDTLFVARGQELWGSFDPDTNEVHPHQERHEAHGDLLDMAAIATLFNGGTVFVVPADQVPGGGLLAAVLRY